VLGLAATTALLLLLGRHALSVHVGFDGGMTNNPDEEAGESDADDERLSLTSIRAGGMGPRRDAGVDILFFVASDGCELRRG
jgi:hypothetical protein